MDDNTLSYLHSGQQHLVMFVKHGHGCRCTDCRYNTNYYVVGYDMKKTWNYTHLNGCVTAIYSSVPISIELQPGNDEVDNSYTISELELESSGLPSCNLPWLDRDCPQVPDVQPLTEDGCNYSIIPIQSDCITVRGVTYNRYPIQLDLDNHSNTSYFYVKVRCQVPLSVLLVETKLH